MRKASLILALAALGAASAAPRAETTTYIEGNLSGVSPNTGATLTLDDHKLMHLRAGSETVAVPYAGISKAELGAVKDNSRGGTFSKFFMHQHSTKTQYLILNFKNQEGQEKTMTLELPQPIAASVLADIKSRRPAPKLGDDWWGDDVWKTPRNADKWSKPAGGSDQR